MADLDIIPLQLLAEYRMLTPTQFAFLEMRSRQLVRRSMRHLSDKGCINMHTPPLGSRRGRPEQFVALTSKGWSHLREHGGITKSVVTELAGAGPDGCPRHHLLLNWFRLHLIQCERTNPNLRTIFREPSSPCIADREIEEALVLKPLSPRPQGRERSRIYPDGVFAIQDRETTKSLLFFLEVDMGTETLVSAKRRPSDIREKIRLYQRIFTEERYKRYESLWNLRFNGFRLLFLTHSSSRLESISKLALQMPPADFIWLAHEEVMFEQGISAPIWVRGGQTTRSPESILGPRLSRPAPVLSTIKD